MRNFKRNRRAKQDRRPRPIRFDNTGYPIQPANNSFATAIAAEEFGFHRHHAWKQWRSFRDTTPGELARRRAS